MAARNIRSRNTGQTGLRHVWLAGLGLASVLRREAVNANDRALAETRRFQRRARGLVADARSRFLAGAEAARGQLDPIVAKFTDGIRRRAAPAWEKLGLQSRVPKIRRKRAVNKTTRRTASGQSRRTDRKA